MFLRLIFAVVIRRSPLQCVFVLTENVIVTRVTNDIAAIGEMLTSGVITIIQDALFKIMQNRTSIIIAHRLSTIQHVDRILVLHKGEIVEEGSHQELLKKEGLYYDLYRLQYS